MAFFLYNSKKIRTRLAGHGDDADTDSYSDEDFDVDEELDGVIDPITQRDKANTEYRNLELLEKR